MRRRRSETSVPFLHSIKFKFLAKNCSKLHEVGPCRSGIRQTVAVMVRFCSSVTSGPIGTGSHAGHPFTILGRLPASKSAVRSSRTYLELGDMTKAFQPGDTHSVVLTGIRRLPLPTCKH
jgi:hypothetical protein